MKRPNSSGKLPEEEIRRSLQRFHRPLGRSTRSKLQRFLSPDPYADTHDSKADVALRALEEVHAAYFASEDALQGKVCVTPARTAQRIKQTLRALQCLEDDADADTNQIIEQPITTLRALLDKRLAILRVQPHVRRTDVRAEHKRYLCGVISLIWNQCALRPEDKADRRRFAVLFLDYAGIPHPGAQHPERLDMWLDTSSTPITADDLGSAAEQARALLE